MHSHALAGAHVNQGHTHTCRLVALMAADAHDAGEGLHQRVIAGQRAHRPDLAKGADRAVHQARVGGVQVVPTQAARLGAARFERVHQHVGRGREPTRELLARRGVEVDTHALLVAVECQKPG